MQPLKFGNYVLEMTEKLVCIALTATLNKSSTSEADAFEQLQELDLGNVFPLDVQVTSFPGTSCQYFKFFETNVDGTEK